MFKLLSKIVNDPQEHHQNHSNRNLSVENQHPSSLRLKERQKFNKNKELKETGEISNEEEEGRTNSSEEEENRTNNSEEDEETINSSEDESITEGLNNGVIGEHKHKKIEKFRGQFKCNLCPSRVLINEGDLQKHLQSKAHKARELKWNRQNDSNIIQSELKTTHSNKEWTQNHKNLCTVNKQVKKNNSKKRKNRIKDISEERIVKLKEKFQRKKQRRIDKSQSK